MFSPAILHGRVGNNLVIKMTGVKLKQGWKIAIALR
jgi:hypothetical protein